MATTHNIFKALEESGNVEMKEKDDNSVVLHEQFKIKTGFNL